MALDWWSRLNRLAPQEGRCQFGQLAGCHGADAEMIDSSDSKATQLWLDMVRPEERRREVAVAMAARAALRVTPLLSARLNRRRARAAILRGLVLPSFRAVALAWAGAKYPARGDSIRVPAAAASRGIADEAFPAALAASHAAAAAATLRAATASGAYHSAAAAALDALGATNTAAAAVIGEVTDYDAAVIDSGSSGAELAGLALWANGTPEWAGEAWRALKSDLLAANEGWEVWADWYEARLAGDEANPTYEALEIARATIVDDIWEEGAAVVNSEVKRLLAVHVQDMPGAESFHDEIGFEPILATRAALRVAPLLVTAAQRKIIHHGPNLFSPCFALWRSHGRKPSIHRW
jgi:hypothetical protein